MKNKKRVKNENGYALLITLLALVLITVIGLSLMTLAMNTARITKSERDNQSSYYIAEAGLVEKRAQINEVARQVFAELKAEYDLIKEPAIKKNFKLEEKFKMQVQERIKTSVVMTGNQTYSEQYAGSPESRVTVTSDVAQPLKYVITSVGKVPSDKGKPKEKTVSQTVEIKMVVPDSSETIEIPGENTVHKFNACFAVYAGEYINYNGGSVKGDIYTPGNIDITNGSITGNVYAGGYIKSSRDIVGDLVAGQQIEITNGSVIGDIHAGRYIKSSRDIQGDLVAGEQIEITGGRVSGNIYGRGILFTNGTIVNSIVSQLDANITGGTVLGSVYGNNVSLSNGTINNNIVSRVDTWITGGSVQKNIISNNNILLENSPGIKGDLIAKNNITVKNKNYSGLSGNYIYGNEIIGENISSSKKKKRADIDTLIAEYPIPNSQSPLNTNINGSSCISNVPTLPDENLAFPSTKASLPPNEKIVSNSNEHNVIQDGKLNINNWLVRDSNYKLILNKDVHFNEININENYTLKIDLQNQHRKIYVDSFNNIQGHIELINPGSLEIIIQNSFNSKGKINVDGEGKTKDLILRYAGSGEINLTGESAINGSFYIKHAPKLTIGNISNSGIQGDLIIFGNTSIEFGGGASVTDNLILAPHSSLTLKGGAAVNGNVIVKSFINNEGHVTPPLQNSGEWEVPGSAPEIIEVPSYDEETTFLITDPLIQK